MNLLLTWLVVALTLIIVAYVLPGVDVSNFGAALVAAVVIGLVNLLIRPLVKLITLPINILTLGLFSFIVNAIMFWLVAALVPGFEVEGFLPALLGSLIMSLVYAVFDNIFDRTMHRA